MLLAVDEINNNGGVKGKKIKLIIEDDAGNPTTAVNAFEKLAGTDKVPMILGPLSSGCSMATAPVAEKNKVVQLSTLAGIPDLSKAGDYIFRIYPSSELGARFAAKQALEIFKPKKIAILFMNNSFGESAKNIYLEVAKESGCKVVTVDGFQEGEKDLKTLLSKVMQGGPDILFCSAYWQDGANILVQMQELGMKMPVIGEDGWRGPLFNLVGEAGLTHLYFSDILFGKEFKDNTVMQEFIANFMTRYNKNASTYSATGYDAVYVAKTALENAKYSGEDIKNILYTIDVKGATGEIKFDKNGDNVGIKFGIFKLDNNNDSMLVTE